MQKHFILMALIAMCHLGYGAEGIAEDVKNKEEQNEQVVSKSGYFHRLSNIFKAELVCIPLILATIYGYYEYKSLPCPNIIPKSDGDKFVIIPATIWFHFCAEAAWYTTNKVADLDNVVDYCSEKVDEWLDSQSDKTNK